MIWFLLTRYTAHLWGVPDLTSDGAIAMCIISTIETMVELGILISWLCEQKNKKDNK